jgi:NAD(P)-dependent dehydrogenase (short-subunit alcohol dehydrogenase family)
MIYVITGTSRGIGLELTRQLIARGDHVVAAARQPSRSPELQQLLEAHPDAITVVQIDVQDHDSVKVYTRI